MEPLRIGGIDGCALSEDGRETSDTPEPLLGRDPASGSELLPTHPPATIATTLTTTATKTERWRGTPLDRDMIP
jgi:hypothetical protein